MQRRREERTGTRSISYQGERERRPPAAGLILSPGGNAFGKKGNSRGGLARFPPGSGSNLPATLGPSLPGACARRSDDHCFDFSALSATSAASALIFGFLPRNGRDQKKPLRGTPLEGRVIFLLCINYSGLVTFSAWRPLGPRVTLNDTVSPSVKVRNPFI